MFSDIELRVIYKVVTKAVNHRKKRKERSTFVPEKGHRDMDLVHIEMMDGIRNKIITKLGDKLTL